MTEKEHTFQYLWPDFVLLLWIWLFVGVVFTGWSSVWGMIPWGSEAGIWVLPAALLSTVLISGTVSGRLSWLGNRMEAVSGYISGLDRFRNTRGGFMAAMSAYVALVFIAWPLRSQNHFMGDGLAFIGTVTGPFRYYAKEPLDYFIHQLFYRLLDWFGVGNGEAVYAVLHTLLLPFFLLACWKITAKVTGEAWERLALWLLIVSTSSLQLFFGYVESYTIIALLLSIYLYYGIKHLREKERNYPWAPTAVFLLSLLTHNSALVLFPSLLYLWLVRLAPGTSWGIIELKSRIVFLISILSFLLLLLFFNTDSLVPLIGPIDGFDSPYRMYGLKHLWDKFNFLLLIAPGAVVCLLVLVAKARSFTKLEDSAFVFVFWAAAGCSFFSFIYDPDLGIRDWDLLSLPAVPLMLWCGWSLILLLPGRERRKAYLFSLAFVSAAHAMLWVWVNADMDRGVRFLDHVRNADFHRGSDRMQLGFLFFERELYKEAANQFRLAGGKWLCTAQSNLTECFLMEGMPDSVIYYLPPLFEKYQMDPILAKKNYMRLTLAYDMQGDPIGATNCFYSMRKQGLSPDEKERTQWIVRMESQAALYNELIHQQDNGGALLYFLRYYTISQNQRKLDYVYKYIMGREFSKSDWARFINFAEVCGHNDYLKPLIGAAIGQYPELLGSQKH
ncbi:MAG TPA: hypothetical protein VM123_09090 [archaeon]|nr:hypothetical protein [archaeon]